MLKSNSRKIRDFAMTKGPWMFYKCPIYSGKKKCSSGLGYVFFFYPCFFSLSGPLKTPHVQLYFTPQATEAYQSVVKSVDTHGTWLALVTASRVPCKTTEYLYLFNGLSTNLVVPHSINASDIPWSFLCFPLTPSALFSSSQTHTTTCFTC